MEIMVGFSRAVTLCDDHVPRVQHPALDLCHQTAVFLERRVVEGDREFGPSGSVGGGGGERSAAWGLARGGRRRSAGSLYPGTGAPGTRSDLESVQPRLVLEDLLDNLLVSLVASPQQRSGSV